MNEKWSEKTTIRKVLDIISGIALCVWLILEALDRANKVQFASFVSFIPVCIICICEAFSLWNVRRSLSYVAIIGVVFMVATIILEIIWIA